MYYKAELEFLTRVLHKMHLQVTEVAASDSSDFQPDFGLRSFLGREDEYATLFHYNFDHANPNTIYVLTDHFHCHYIYLQLPSDKPIDPSVLLIGPYFSFDISHEQFLELAEQLGVSLQNSRELEHFFSNVPVIKDEVAFFAMINSFGETLWGAGTEFKIVDLNQEFTGPVTPLSGEDGSQKRDILLEMRNMESRYAFENELIETVALGQSHRAELMIESFPAAAFEQRIADPIRNLKNYCVICNTLLRKAAEKGGVHPIYLDKTSSELARKIETLSDTYSGKELLRDMIRSYCRLVRKHSMKNYSSPTQKALAYIDADLSGDLSLRTLAAMQGISGSYLSALFKKETGQTITDYVNQKRVKRAVQLLSTTKLQVQTIAQYCGISDVNYFSKIFKKYTDKTPKEFRKEIQNQIPSPTGVRRG